MNDSNVFVLGAGASYDLGFPLGTKLVSEVLQTLAGSGSEEYQKLYRLIAEEHGEKTVLSMGESLRKSGLSSIDRFLEQHRENPIFQDIGYRSIANIIHYYETEHRLYANNHWYGLLHNRIFDDFHGDFQGYKNAPIAFITFNYDRSLEQFLFNAIQHTFPEIEDVEKEFLASIQPKILHVHGSLGSILELPYQPFEKNHFPDLLMECSRKLRIVGDGGATDSEAIQARQLIGNADHVHIMGFGFDPANMRKIGLPQSFQGGCLVKGTKKGMSVAQAYGADQELRRGGTRNIELSDLDCSEYFQERVILR